jgi:hypothetical protein
MEPAMLRKIWRAREFWLLGAFVGLIVGAIAFIYFRYIELSYDLAFMAGVIAGLFGMLFGCGVNLFIKVFENSQKFRD